MPRSSWQLNHSCGKGERWRPSSAASPSGSTYRLGFGECWPFTVLFSYLNVSISSKQSGNRYSSLSAPACPWLTLLYSMPVSLHLLEACLLLTGSSSSSETPIIWIPLILVGGGYC